MMANLSRCEDASAISFNDSSFRYSSFNFPDVTRLHQVFTFEQYNKKNVNTARSGVKRKTALEIIPVQFFFIYSVLRRLLSYTYSRYSLPVLTLSVSPHLS